MSFRWCFSLPCVLCALTVAIAKWYELHFGHVWRSITVLSWHLLLLVMGSVIRNRCSTPMTAINAIAEIKNRRYFFHNQSPNHYLLLGLKILSNWFSIDRKKLNQHLMIRGIPFLDLGSCNWLSVSNWFWPNLAWIFQAASNKLFSSFTVVCKIHWEFGRFHWKSWFEEKVWCCFLAIFVKIVTRLQFVYFISFHPDSTISWDPER